MHTVITAKYQTTIPKKIRQQLHLSINDTIDWQVEGGRIVVVPIQNTFLSFQNAVKVGAGDIDADLVQARNTRLKKYQ